MPHTPGLGQAQPSPPGTEQVSIRHWALGSALTLQWTLGQVQGVPLRHKEGGTGHPRSLVCRTESPCGPAKQEKQLSQAPRPSASRLSWLSHGAGRVHLQGATPEIPSAPPSCLPPAGGLNCFLAGRLGRAQGALRTLPACPTA